KKANWDLFKVFLESNFHAAGPISDIEEAYSYLLTSFTKARDISVPSSNKNVHRKYAPYWNSECRDAKKAKKLAEKNLRKSKVVANQLALKKCKSKFKASLLKAKELYWSKFCSNLNHQTKIKVVWDTISKMKGKIVNTKIQFRNENGTVLDDD